MTLLIGRKGCTHGECSRSYEEEQVERKSVWKKVESFDYPNPDLETETLSPSGHCESRQKRDKVRGNLIEKDEIASVPSQ